MQAISYPIKSFCSQNLSPVPRKLTVKCHLEPNQKIKGNWFCNCLFNKGMWKSIPVLLFLMHVCSGFSFGFTASTLQLKGFTASTLQLTSRSSSLTFFREDSPSLGSCHGSSQRRCKQRSLVIKCLEFAQPEFITFPQKMFTAVNFAVLPFWGLMIFLPKGDFTKSIMTSTLPIFLLIAIHLSIVSYGLVQPGSVKEFEFLATQGFVKLSAMMEMRNYPAFVSEEWAHVLAWDLFVGRWIYLDGLKKSVPTPHSLFFCFLLGPLGLFIHFITRAAVTKNFSSMLSLD